MSVGAVAIAPSRAVSPKQVGIAGIVLAAVAWVITIPPIEVTRHGAVDRARRPCRLRRGVVGRGRRAQGRDPRRSLWPCSRSRARAASVNSAVATLESVFTWSALFAATLRFATPLIFGALGGIDLRALRRREHRPRGHDADGRYFGIYGADLTSSWVPGLLDRDGRRRRPRLVHAVFSIHLRADQIVSGIAINLLALGITGYFFAYHYGDKGTPRTLAAPRHHAAADQEHPLLRRRDRPREPADVARAPARPALSLFLFRTRGGCACARSASTRARPRRSASRCCARAMSRWSPRACSRRSAVPTCRSGSSARSTRT